MSKNPYPRRTEPDMRQEMINTLDGAFPEIAKGQTAILRQMSTTQCPCVDFLTKEPDKDTYCPVCMGEGYLWDEIFITVYKVVLKSDVGNALKERLWAPGLINKPLVVFYVCFSVDVSKEDKVIELILDIEGAPVRPYKRRAIYRIGTVFDIRSDNGRLEYWKIDTYEEDVKFLNGSTG